MTRVLAITWDTEVLRYVLADANKNAALTIAHAGEQKLQTQTPDAALTADEATAESEPPTEESPTLPAIVADLVREHKATNATLVVCVSRGAVDSVSFQVPPANDAELPALVRNMAIRQLPGITEDNVIDFISYPAAESGARSVSAMSLSVNEQQLIQEVIDASGCQTARTVVATQPLRIFSPPPADGDDTASLIVCRGRHAVHVLVSLPSESGELPVLSRTIRLAGGMKSQTEATHIAGEIQRTLITAGDEIELNIEITRCVVVGAEIETSTLAEVLDERFPMQVQRVSAQSLVDGEIGEAAGGTFASLIAAAKQEALGTVPAIDFSNPRRPPKAVNPRNRIIAAVAAIVLLISGGWYYVHTQFAEVEQANAALKERVRELDELVKSSRKKRNLARLLSSWEKSRINWLDELRDITIRMPQSQRLSVGQFSATGSGSGAVVSFAGTSQDPLAIRLMEENLRDSWHQPKTPGIREVKSGKKSSWTFQTSMRIKPRSKDKYTAHTDYLLARKKRTLGEESPKGVQQVSETNDRPKPESKSNVRPATQSKEQP